MRINFDWYLSEIEYYFKQVLLFDLNSITIRFK
jgi:hypothetical protein